MHNIAHIQSLSVLPPVPPPRPEGGWVQLSIIYYHRVRGKLSLYGWDSKACFRYVYFVKCVSPPPPTPHPTFRSALMGGRGRVYRWLI